MSMTLRFQKYCLTEVDILSRSGCCMEDVIDRFLNQILDEALIARQRNQLHMGIASSPDPMITSPIMQPSPLCAYSLVH